MLIGRSSSGPGQIIRTYRMKFHSPSARVCPGTANSGPFMHHGKFTTMREAVLAHSGEALASRQAFEALSPFDRDCLIEFLKTLQVLPSQTTSPVVDENGRPKMPSHGPN